MHFRGHKDCEQKYGAEIESLKKQNVEEKAARKRKYEKERYNEDAKKRKKEYIV